MNTSRSKPAPTVNKTQVDSDTERKTAGGMLKKLKSKRSQTEKWPVVTEDELKALGRDISPDHVLGLRDVTEGILFTICSRALLFGKLCNTPNMIQSLKVQYAWITSSSYKTY